MKIKRTRKLSVKSKPYKITKVTYPCQLKSDILINHTDKENHNNLTYEQSVDLVNILTDIICGRRKVSCLNITHDDYKVSLKIDISKLHNDNFDYNKICQNQSEINSEISYSHDQPNNSNICKETNSNENSDIDNIAVNEIKRIILHNKTQTKSPKRVLKHKKKTHKRIRKFIKIKRRSNNNKSRRKLRLHHITKCKGNKNKINVSSYNYLKNNYKPGKFLLPKLMREPEYESVKVEDRNGKGEPIVKFVSFQNPIEAQNNSNTPTDDNSKNDS